MCCAACALSPDCCLQTLDTAYTAHDAQDAALASVLPGIAAMWQILQSTANGTVGFAEGWTYALWKASYSQTYTAHHRQAAGHL